MGNAGGDFSTLTGAFSRLILDLASGANDFTHLDETETEFLGSTTGGSGVSIDT